MNRALHDASDVPEALVAEWSELCVADPAATVFHTPEYSRVWTSEFGSGRSAWVVEIRSGGALAGVASLSMDSDGVLRFLGDLETTDYLGPVSRLQDREEVASAVLRAALGVGDWQRAEFHGISADSGWLEPLELAAQRDGLAVHSRPQDVCPRVSLGASFEDYLRSLPQKLRHEIGRKARRAQRLEGDLRVRLSDAASLDADLATFYAMHRSSDGPKGKFLHEGMASFFSELARTACDAGWLRLAFLEARQGPLAGALGFSWRGTFSLYNSAYEHSRGASAPGMVLSAEAIRIAAEEGSGVFDFLRGAESYKYRFGAVDIPLFELSLART